MSTIIDDILAKLNPEETKKQLETQREVWRGELHRIAAIRSVTEMNPKIGAEQKQTAMDALDKSLIDLDWAITEIDSRIAQAGIAQTVALNGNRAARRHK